MGSNPTILKMYKLTESTRIPWLQNINFYWTSLFKYFFLRIINSFLFTIPYYKNILLTSFLKGSVKFNNTLSFQRANLNQTLWQTQMTRLNFELIRDNSFLIPTTRLRVTNNKLNTKLFLLYLSYSNGVSGVVTHLNSNYKTLFIGLFNKNSYPYINTTKLFQIWTQTYTLLFNLFFNQTQVLLFSTKILQKEAYAFNWSRDVKTYLLFKYSIPFFFLKNPSYGLETDIGFSKLATLGLEVSFITDVRYHYRTVNFLKKYNIYTIGLVPYNISPWTLHYPIPISVNNIFLQYFFIKYLFFLKTETNLCYYNTLYKIV